MTIFVLHEIPRTWGKIVVQLVGEGVGAHTELRAFRGTDGKSFGVTLRGAELEGVIAALTNAQALTVGPRGQRPLPGVKS